MCGETPMSLDTLCQEIRMQSNEVMKSLGRGPQFKPLLLFVGDERFILFKATSERLYKCRVFKGCLHVLYMSLSASVPTQLSSL